MNTNCLCENPTIILNPNARDFILRDGAFYFRGTVPGEYKLYKLNDGIGFFSRQRFYYKFSRRFFSCYMVLRVCIGAVLKTVSKQA